MKSWERGTVAGTTRRAIARNPALYSIYFVWKSRVVLISEGHNKVCLSIDITLLNVGNDYQFDWAVHPVENLKWSDRASKKLETKTYQGAAELLASSHRPRILTSRSTRAMPTYAGCSSNVTDETC